jgi:hypothetical protein
VNPGGVVRRRRARQRSGRRPEGSGSDVFGFRCSGGLDCDFEAECLELVQESARAVFGRIAAGEPVRAELAVGQSVADDVVVGDEDVVTRSADCLWLAAAATDLPVVGSEVGALCPRGGLGRLGQGLAEPTRAAQGLARVVLAGRFVVLLLRAVSWHDSCSPATVGVG